MNDSPWIPFGAAQGNLKLTMAGFGYKFYTIYEAMDKKVIDLPLIAKKKPGFIPAFQFHTPDALSHNSNSSR